MKQSDVDSSLFHVYRMFPLLATVFQNRVATIHSVAQNKNKKTNKQQFGQGNERNFKTNFRVFGVRFE